jgi:hypothetical protein
MKSLSKRFFGEKPMKMWEKIAGTWMSAIMMPTSFIFLFFVTHFFGQWNTTFTAQTDHFVAVVGAIVCALGLLLSIYGTWYLWAKIPLEKEK